jgi:hypothetical protein
MGVPGGIGTAHESVRGESVVTGVWQWVVLGGWVVGGAAMAAAQSTTTSADVPPAYVPPPGMCRVWLRGVPPVQQPAPTDCRNALRTKPVGGTVVYGPDAPRPSVVPGDWSRPSLRSGREDDRGRASIRPGADSLDPAECEDGGRDPRCDDLAASLPFGPQHRGTHVRQRPADLQRWFGALNVAARFSMPARGATPERVQWFDSDGRLVQVWTDRNGDGRADRVEMFNRDGARIRVVGQ